MSEVSIELSNRLLRLVLELYMRPLTEANSTLVILPNSIVDLKLIRAFRWDLITLL